MVLMMTWMVKEANFTVFYKQTIYGQKFIRPPIVRMFVFIFFLSFIREVCGKKLVFYTLQLIRGFE